MAWSSLRASAAGSRRSTRPASAWRDGNARRQRRRSAAASVAHARAVKAASSSAVAVLSNVARNCCLRGLRADPLAEVLRLRRWRAPRCRRSLRGRARAVPARARTRGSGWRRRRRWRGRGRRAHRSRGGGRRPRGRSRAVVGGGRGPARRPSPARVEICSKPRVGRVERGRARRGSDAGAARTPARWRGTRLTAASVRVRAPCRARPAARRRWRRTTTTRRSRSGARGWPSSSVCSGRERSPYCSCAWRAVNRSLRPAAATTTSARNGTKRTSSSLARKLSRDVSDCPPCKRPSSNFTASSLRVRGRERGRRSLRHAPHLKWRNGSAGGPP